MFSKQVFHNTSNKMSKVTAVIVDGQPLRFSYNVGGLLLAFDHDDDYSHINVIFMKVGENAMQTIKASEFKAKCLRLMDEVNHTGEGIIITKNGNLFQS